MLHNRSIGIEIVEVFGTLGDEMTLWEPLYMGPGTLVSETYLVSE